MAVTTTNPDARLRVLWFSHSSGLGGSEIGLLEAARGLTQQGIDIHVVMPDAGPLLDRLHDAGIPATVAGYPWWMSDPASPRNARRQHLVGHLRPRLWIRLARVMRAARPDLVVTNTSTIAVGALSAALFRVPHVWYVREFGQADYELRFDLGERPARRLMTSLSRAVVVNSEALRRAFAERVSDEKLRVVRYAISVERETPAESEPLQKAGGDELELLLLGSLRPSKGQAEAIAAVGKLAGRGIGVRLRLAGGGPEPYRRELELLATELGVADRVAVGGFENAPAEAIRAADVVLVCSRQEAFGRTTIEAMGLGRPVIGARSGATPELVGDGTSGLLYRPGDPVDLADKIALLAGDRPLLARLGRTARETSRERFDFETYLSDLAGVFAAAAKRDGSA
jgi:glycosyltransferase involved in cell wall biosynthesis